MVLRGAFRDPGGPGRVSRFHRTFPRAAARRQALDRADQPPAAGAAPPRSQGVRAGEWFDVSLDRQRDPRFDAGHGRQPRGPADGRRARGRRRCCCRQKAFKEAQRMARALGAGRTLNRRSAATVRRVRIPFNSSPRTSLGIEWELQLVDPATPRAGVGRQRAAGRARRRRAASTPRPSTSSSSRPSRSSPASA